MSSMQMLALEKQRLDLAMNNMAQGLIMFDAAERMVVCNDLYIEMYGLSREIVKPGCSFLEVLQYRAAAGSFLHQDPENVSRRGHGGIGIGQSRQ